MLKVLYVVCLSKQLIASSSVLSVNCVFLCPLLLLSPRLKKFVTLLFIHVCLGIRAFEFVVVRCYGVFIVKISSLGWYILRGEC